MQSDPLKCIFLNECKYVTCVVLLLLFFSLFPKAYIECLLCIPGDGRRDLKLFALGKMLVVLAW